MLLTPELLIGLGAAFAIVVVLLLFRARAARGNNVQRPVFRGPPNMRFTCVGCSEQFTHTKRTIGAWEKGTRRFYCNACHTKWRGSHPLQSIQENSAVNSGVRHANRGGKPISSADTVSTAHTSFRSVRGGSGSGCLGVMVLLIAVPIVVTFVVAQYA